MLKYPIAGAAKSMADQEQRISFFTAVMLLGAIIIHHLASEYDLEIESTAPLKLPASFGAR
jgi:hypothetical protein